MYIRYCVKYRRYQYNMCYRGHADNGYYDEENWYDTEEEAQDFIKRFLRVFFAQHDTKNRFGVPDKVWERLGIYDGYGVKILGLFKVTFEEMKLKE